MKFYHVETQEDYDALMKELDEKGYYWSNYQGVFDTNEWLSYKSETVVCANDNKKELSYSNKEFFQSRYPNEEIVKYKAKQEDPTTTPEQELAYKRTQADKTERHKEISEELNAIYIFKNHDYGDSFGETFRKLGIISAVTRISDKVNRLQSLAVKTEEDRKVKDESIKDTLYDLANYAIMSIIELEREAE